MPRPRRRWLRWLAWGVLFFFVLVAGGVGWLLGTSAGLRFALQRAEGFTHGALQVQGAQGRLLGPLHADGVRYDDGAGTQVVINRLDLDWQAWALVYKRLHVIRLTVDSADVTLPKAAAATSSSSHFSLQPPLGIVLDSVQVGPVRVTQDRQRIFESDQLDLAGRWTGDGIDVNRLSLHAPAGHVSVDGQLGIGRRYRGKGHADIAWNIGDNGYAGTIDAQGDGRRAQLRLSLTQPMLAQLQLAMDQRKDNAWAAQLDLPSFDPKPLLGASALTRVAAHVQASGDHYQGSVSGELDLNDYRVQLQPLQGAFDRDFKTFTLQQLQLASPQIKGQLNASGSIRLDAQPVSAGLTLGWKNLELPAALAGQLLDSRGQLAVSGSAERYHAQGDIMLGPPGKLAKLALNLDGTPRQIQLHTLDVEQPQGQLAAHGTLTLDPVLDWQFKATAKSFDPGQLFAQWPGLLDADFDTHGTLAKNQPYVTLDLRKLEGTLRQRRLHGAGHLHLSPNEVLDGTLELASGNSTVKVLARPGNANHADITLAIASLGDWLPQSGGQLDGQFRVRGKLPQLAIDGSLQGQSIAWQQQAIQRLHLQAGMPDVSHPGGTLTLNAYGATLGGLAFHQIEVNAHGSSAQHQLTVSAQGQPLSVTLALHGALKEKNWNGTLSALALDLQGLPRWRLREPARVAWNNGNASLGELCLTAGDPLLCVNGGYDQAGNLDVSYRVHAVPLTLLMDAAGDANIPITAEGALEGNGKLHRNAAGSLSGNASISSAQGHILYNEHPDQPALIYRNLALNATLAPGNQQATLNAAINGNGYVHAQASITGVQQTLNGQIGVQLDDLGIVELFTDALANIKGRLNGTFALGGSVTEPVITGAASVTGFAAEVPDAGLKLSQGRLTVGAANAHQLHIDGTVQSGQGSLTLQGIAGLDAQTPTVIGIKGNQFTAADIPAAKVVISPDLTLRHDPQGVNATGSVTIESAEINLDKLPGNGVNKASPDVVIVDQAQPAPSAAAMPINASIKVDLGRRAHLVGQGLDGHLGGILTVNERPGRDATGQGQVSIDGTYKAYGQNLQIQHGLLLFASSPLANPGLNIRALRSLTPNATVDQGQQVGLQISGTAQRPVLTVFSNPAMDQSDALSYLVTGKPLSQVKGGEGSAVSAAAQALGSATGNLLAKSVGAKLGISDIGIASSDALNGNSAFTVGKYLSPRLYLSYGIGLFEPGQVITLRYRLSKRWSFEAQNATDFNRASLDYRIEK